MKNLEHTNFQILQYWSDAPLSGSCEREKQTLKCLNIQTKKNVKRANKSMRDISFQKIQIGAAPAQF